jgi:hypothetical protein
MGLNLATFSWNPAPRFWGEWHAAALFRILALGGSAEGCNRVELMCISNAKSSVGIAAISKTPEPGFGRHGLQMGVSLVDHYLRLQFFEMKILLFLKCLW